MTSALDEQRGPTVVTLIDGRRFELAPAPVCSVCGHRCCPMCRTWCDEMVPGRSDGCYDFCDCGDTQCTYDAAEHKAWCDALDELTDIAQVEC